MALLPTGLLAAGGIGQGLSSFTDAFLRTKKQTADTRRADAMTGLLAQKQGFDYDPSTGAVAQNDLGQAQQAGLLAKSQLGAAQSQNALRDLNESNDADSDTAKATNHVNAALGQYLSKKGYGDLGDTLADDSVSPRVKSIITDHPAMKELLAGAKSDSDFQKALTVAKVRANAVTDAATTRADASTDKVAAGADKSANKDAAGLLNTIRHDDEFKKSSSQIREAESLKNVATEAVSNPAAANAMGVYAARYVSQGQRINRQEMEALGGGEKDILGRLGQIVDTASKGTLTPENAAFMAKFVDVTSKTAARNAGEAEDAFTGNYARTHSMDPDKASQLVVGHPTYATQQKGLLRQAPTDPLEGRTATNPQTGQKVMRKGGQWVPVTQ